MTVTTQLVNAIMASGSAAFGGRIYNMKMPTKNPTFPLIVYQRVTAPVNYNLDGNYCHSDISYQFVCWSDTLDTAQAAAQVVYNALSMYKADPIWRTYIDNKRESREAATGLYFVIVEVTCRAEEF